MYPEVKYNCFVLPVTFSEVMYHRFHATTLATPAQRLQVCVQPEPLVSYNFLCPQIGCLLICQYVGRISQWHILATLLQVELRSDRRGRYRQQDLSCCQPPTGHVHKTPFSSLRRILPEGLLGMLLRNCTPPFNCLCSDTFAATNRFTSSSETPGRAGTTKALGTSPALSSGTPTTATSSMSG